MKRIIIILFGLILPMLGGGCSWWSGNGENDLKIGVIMPLSGEFAPYGKAVIQGMELYREKYAAIHPDRHIVLLIEDNGGTPEGSLKAFETLVDRKQVQVIVGAYTSDDSFALKPLALRRRIPVIAPCATNDELTARNPYLFRACFNDSFQGKALGKYAWEKGGVKKLGVLWCLDANRGDYSRGLARTVIEEFEKCGGAPVCKVGYRSGQTDFTAQLHEFKQAGVDAVFAPLYPDDILRLMKAVAALNDAPLIFGSDSWSSDGLVEKLGEPGHGSFYSCMFSRQYRNPVTTEFVNTARDKGLEPGLCMAQGYDTLGILATVMKPGARGEDIASALRQVRNYPGVTGAISIYADGVTTQNVFIEKIVWDKFNKRALKTLEYTIKPEEER